MTEHPGDNADTRFRAFWAGVLGFVSFGIVLLLALKAFGPGDEGEMSAVGQQVVEARLANLAEVSSAQAGLVPESALESALESAISSLSDKSATKTELVVPNSPTFLKQMTESQAPAEEEPEAEAKADDAEEPAVEKPAAPAEEKK